MRVAVAVAAMWMSRRMGTAFLPLGVCDEGVGGGSSDVDEDADGGGVCPRQ